MLPYQGDRGTENVYKSKLHCAQGLAFGYEFPELVPAQISLFLAKSLHGLCSCIRTSLYLISSFSFFISTFLFHPVFSPNIGFLQYTKIKNILKYVLNENDFSTPKSEIKIEFKLSKQRNKDIKAKTREKDTRNVIVFKMLMLQLDVIVS